ncbi:Dyp-type peroxidase [Sphingobium nicotianae]|uniref:Peroxidase n=1 Tax=Sphingobium nicotianae TaxID=2782607 RepID=A0A9X1DA03_9SPHN|nr:hypothetical protein [Sphingobium nicotianae]MBT2186131.1 hypothetical protein [Sphingobium nicotianae]
MTQSMITVAVRIDAAQVEAAQALIDTSLGNPAREVGLAIAGDPTLEEEKFVHFGSLHAIRSHRPGRGYLVLEMSADGEPRQILERLATRAGDAFLPIFRIAKESLRKEDLATFLIGHLVTVGHGLFQTAGLCFAGIPGRTVGEIENEAALAREIARLLAGHEEQASALAHLEAVRAALSADPQWSWAKAPPPPVPPHPRADPTPGETLKALIPGFIKTFLWPALLIFLPLSVWLAWPAGGWPWPPVDGSSWPHLVTTGVAFALYATLLLVLEVVTLLLMVYLAFSRAEAADVPSDTAPTFDDACEMFAHENAPGYAHNHMLSHTIRKPGLLRYLTTRLAFWIIAARTALNPRVGHLGDIGTIHFARWVTIPGTRDLLFFSNYGGSWESYLEDFITKAHEGLTGAWSNTIGFPRTTNLFFDGATDGERFKRFARQSMRYTPFWYSAYPTLTTANIRDHAAIRRGLHVETETEAAEWLTLFGSARRPAEKLDTPQIQSIVFGGMGFKPEGRVVTIRLGDDIAANQAALAEIFPAMSFNDGRYIAREAVVTIGVTCSGLAKLGLPEDAVESFPAAFLLGMRGEGRARILGDDPNADWWWDKDAVDGVLLVYGDTVEAVAALTDMIARALPPGARLVDQIDLVRVAGELTDRKEPFGFVDGISQPAIRGTYRGLRNADPIHLVEPGEIILGYPDNRRSIPTGPMLRAKDDPAMMLPIAGDDHEFEDQIGANPRLVGMNGSFLVVRQLEQHHERFWDYCTAQAKSFSARFPEPVICDAEFIAAKMIGRWTDGSSLVRNPYMSASRLKQLSGKASAPQLKREKTHPANMAATPIEAADREAAATPAVKPDNDYLFGTEDPQGLRCPYGAHVRRANPRDSLDPGSMEQVEITNRHRILRIGRGFAAREGRSSGLMFMCLNADIERQFEFIQQTWMGSVKFHGLDAETDPIAVAGTAGSNGFTVPVRTGPVALAPMPNFVTLRGGGYFFVPGRHLLRYLANGGPSAKGRAARV